MPGTNTNNTTTHTTNNELTIATTQTMATAATSSSGNILVKSPTSPSIREKAEKLLYSGGHYTPPVTLECERNSRKSEDVQKQRSLPTTSPSLSSNTNANIYKTAEVLTTIEMEETAKEEVEVQETIATSNSRLTTSLNVGISGTQLDSGSSTIRTTGARSPLTQQQSHLKRDSEQTRAAHLITKTQRNEKELLPLLNDKSTTVGISKLFDSLQNNQFVKNQQQQPSSPKKFKKKQEATTSVTGSPTKLYASAVVAGSSLGLGVGVGVSVKKKMVAVQEMKKTTQNANHPHHRVHHQRHAAGMHCGNEQQQTSNNAAYDSGEDLSYGPGIVEKLRDRYLSWAQRESLVEQQRRSLETLRRATSLSTLLDREQQMQHEEDVDVDDDGDIVDVDVDVDVTNVFAQNNYNKQLTNVVPPVPTQRLSISQQHSNNTTKIVSGILKSSNNNVGLSETTKKTATFQNNNNNYSSDQNGSNSSEITSSGGGIGRGSRGLKRGNDSLKRARSVEALLSERAAWNFMPTLNSNSPSNGAGVTIEDKINNARDRLLMGTDTMPPKRLTSIIDETERPPPDLVKQTLKKFEATANRRPRPTRANSKGEVASKVATFKSIINEQKPSVLLPKPPNSPTKRATHMDGVCLKPVAKPIVLAVEEVVLLSPTGRRGKTTSALSDQTPDLIPRQKHLLNTTSNSSRNSTTTDSPVTALTKRIEKLRLSTGVSNEYKAEITRQATNLAAEQNSHDRAYENQNEHEYEIKNNKENQQLVGDDAAAATYENETRQRRCVDEVLLDIVVVPVDNDNLAETTGIGSPSGSSSVFSDDEDSLGLTKRVSRRALDNIAKAGTTQQFKFVNNQELRTSPSDNNMRPLINSAASTTVKQKSAAAFATHLTSREIEKNRINELKKTTTTENSTGSSSSSSASSLDNVIQKHSSPGQCELDASGNVASASPLWGAMCKRRVAPPVAVADTTSMVFNFSNRKEVPDYIESDVVIYRRKRELPKPNESGFVMLGDLTVETSTDSDYDDFSLCPPSPCDVEFENANIVIDGKSSIRHKSKDATFRVQFNDTLTSTFEYPSETSLIVEDDSSFHSPYAHTDADNSLISNFENLMLEEPDSPAHRRHHHVAVDEIIPLPTSAANYTTLNVANNTNTNSVVANVNEITTTTNTPTKNVLGNLPLGSAPLGSYTPVKAPIDNLFQLGVTRVPNSNGHAYNGNGGGGESNGSIIGIADGLINGGDNEAPDSLQQYLKPANDDLTVAYSEGAHKTDLLY